MAVAAIPVLVLVAWVQTTAFERELDEVEERHLLIAKNLTLALERYADDACTVLELYGDMVFEGMVYPRMGMLGRELGFVYFCSLDQRGPAADHIIMDDTHTASLTVEQDELMWLLAADEEVHFSGVMADGDGVSTIYIIKRTDEHRLVMGALSANDIVEQQQSIAFGKLGHAAIVDQFGHVVAYPNPQWTVESKGISKVLPGQHMMARETGVTEFYSPAVKVDMVTGYTLVPYTEWGVMVPQPLGELEDAARHVWLIAYTISAIALVGAGMFSWVLAGIVIRPLNRV